MAAATSSHPLFHPLLLLDLDTARSPLGEGAGGAPGAVVMAKHFPPSNGAVAPGQAQGAPGAAPRKSMASASTATLSLVPYLGTGATLYHPSALASAAPRRLQGNSNSSKAGGIQVGVLGVALCTQPGYSKGVRGSRESTLYLSMGIVVLGLHLGVFPQEPDHELCSCSIWCPCVLL